MSFCVFYELDCPDCEPELMKIVSNLDDAWNCAISDINVAHNTCPEDCPKIDEFTIVNNRNESDDTYVLLSKPTNIEHNKIYWIAIADRNTYFVFTGGLKQWNAYDSRDPN